ncbi:MAG: DNA-processing protein DprA [Candidatus Coproplasma sp.]
MNYTNDETNLIIADGFTELNYRQKKLLICVCASDCPEREKYERELIKTLGLGVYNKLRTAFSDGAFRAETLSRLEKKGVSCVTLKSGSYPELLKNIPVPPLVLYCKGNLKLLSEPCFAVVGSRRTLNQSLAACRAIAGELTEHFTVVTGVADGADGAAVGGALKSGRVICVLPNGHDYYYPVANADLIKKVEERGLVISEFPPEVSPQKYFFTVRNRIIAGLSRGVLVVSAAKRSGALITAGYAADYGREVFAFPYSLGVTSGEGCNALIKNGAALCENVLDIFSCFGLEYKSAALTALSDDERAVLEYLKQNGQSHIQNIATALGKKIFQVSATCASLEIKGVAASVGGNRYAPVR